MVKYVNSIKFGENGETYVIKDSSAQTAIENMLEGDTFVETDQGIENAGKLLSVDNNGKVVPTTIEIPSVEGLASEQYVDSAIEEVEGKIPSIEGLASEQYVDSALEGKQNVLTAGTNITIENDVISATGGAGASSFSELVGDPMDNSALADALNAKANASDLQSLEDKVDTKQDIIDSNHKLDVALVDGALTASDIAGKADSATTLAGYGIEDAYTKTEVDTALNAKADVSTTYTKTEVDTALATKANSEDIQDLVSQTSMEEYVSSQVEGLASETYVDDAIAGIDIPEDVVTREDATFENVDVTETVYAVNLGHLYKGKRYDIGAKADDGTTVTTKQRKVTDPIALALEEGAITYVPMNWGAAGANYTEICLFPDDNGQCATQALIFTKKSGKMEQATVSAVGPLTLIADSSIETYTFDTVNQIIHFNPEYVQWYRGYCTDDTTTIRITYTRNITETVKALNISDGFIKEVTPVGEYVARDTGLYAGQVYNVPSLHAWKVPDNVTWTYQSTVKQYAMDDPTLTATINSRLYTLPIELLYDGVIFDSTIYDTNGAGYGVVTFLDENYAVTAYTDGISGMSTLTIQDVRVYRDENATTMTVDEGTASGSGGTVDHMYITIPKNDPAYKYVVVCVSNQASGTQADFAQMHFPYHYINEPVPVITTNVRLEDYIQGKIPTEINDKYTWSRMYGKSVCLFGGSFATDNYGKAAHDYWKEKLGITLTNYAVGGAGVIEGIGTVPMLTQVQQMITAGKKHDLYIIWCSTNDLRRVGDAWTQGTSVTVAGHTYPGENFELEVFGEEGSSDTSTQRGGLNTMIRNIRNFDPEAKIIMFTSMRHFASQNGYQYNLTTGSSARTFVDDQISVCNYWSIPYVDQFRIWGVMTDNKSIFVKSDNLHPTDAGYLRIAPHQLDLIARM